jgi:hypothetical protein
MRHPSRNQRRPAIAAGVLYICGTLAGASSLAVSGGGVDGPDYLQSAASLGDSLAVGALLLVVMGLALAFIPIVLFPILRATSERLAVAYVVFRGGLETMTTLTVAASWFVLFQLGSDSGEAAGAAALNSAGEAVYRMGDTVGTLGSIVFVTGALAFYWVLWRARLVPRWLSGWGLIALAPYAAVALLGLLGVLDVLSGPTVAMQAPLAVQEMVLAAWLIVRGLRTERTPKTTGPGMTSALEPAGRPVLERSP